jgi:hypothetical protein
VARPSNTFESLSMTIAVTPQIKWYLEDLTLKGTWGSSPAEAARMLLSKAIDDMVDKNSLKRREFKLEGTQVVPA